jgi:hypothetical protein
MNPVRTGCRRMTLLFRHPDFSLLILAVTLAAAPARESEPGG